MKKKFLLLVMLLPMMALAQDPVVQVNNIWYTINGNYARAYGGSNCSGNVVIPTTVTYYINDIPRNATVIGINERTFSGSTIESITIPKTVTSISNDAFYNCKNLASIVIDGDNGVYDSRDNCNAIIETNTNTLIVGCKNTVIPNTVTSIGNYAFWGSGLTNIIIPSSITNIGEYAFCGSGITSITIPSSITNIGSYAFSNCSSLTTAVIKDGCMASIGSYAFQGSGLTSITIPSSMNNISDKAFYGCGSLTSVDIQEGPTSIGIGAFQYCNDLASVTIPNSVTSIGSGAFSDCSELTTIIIPNTISSIGSNAFDNTAWYTNLPDGVVYVGKLAYTYKGTMPSNTRMTLQDGTLGIADNAFSGCKNLTFVSIPNTVEFIGVGAFSGCSNLVVADIGNPVNGIGADAFNQCPKLTSVTTQLTTPISIASNTFSNRANAKLYVPKGRNTLYSAAEFWSDFKAITAINDPSPFTKVDIPDVLVKNICLDQWDTSGDRELDTQEAAAVTDLGSSFSNNKDLVSFNELSYFTGLTSISSSAFRGCSNITSISIPNNVTSIDDYAFNSCSSLTNVTIGNSVTSIGQSAFWGCTSLAEIAFPNSVTSIGTYAFAGCSDLASINIPQSVTSIGTYAFEGCTSVSSISVDTKNTKYDSRNNCNAIIDKDNNTLIWGCKNTVIPNTVNSIGNNAFSKCSGLTSITIPNNVTSLGDGAFSQCDGLTSISIPSVTSIGMGCFRNCTNLTSVELSNSLTIIDQTTFSGCGLTTITIPNGVTTIDYAAFQFCKALTNVIIPSSVNKIQMYAFSSCTALDKVILYSPSLNSYPSSVFNNNASGRKIYVLADKVTNYKAYWSDYSSTIEPIALTANDAGTSGKWCTYYNEKDNITVSSGTTIYKAKLDEANNKVLLTEVEGDIIKAGEAVVLNSTSGSIELSSAASAGTGDYSDNDLKGGSSVAAGNVPYTLANSTDGLGFYKFDIANYTLDPYKAHLEVASSGARKYYGFRDGDDNTTSIKTPVAVTEQGDAAVYDLTGRRIEGYQLNRGVYVKNGKKFIVK